MAEIGEPVGAVAVEIFGVYRDVAGNIGIAFDPDSVGDIVAAVKAFTESVAGATLRRILSEQGTEEVQRLIDAGSSAGRETIARLKDALQGSADASGH